MALVRWAPARELYPVQSEINRLFNTLFDTATPVSGRVSRRWTPALDILENDGDYVVCADLPQTPTHKVRKTGLVDLLDLESAWRPPSRRPRRTDREIPGTRGRG